MGGLLSLAPSSCRRQMRACVGVVWWVGMERLGHHGGCDYGERAVHTTNQSIHQLIDIHTCSRQPSHTYRSYDVPLLILHHPNHFGARRAARVGVLVQPAEEAVVGRRRGARGEAGLDEACPPGLMHACKCGWLGGRVGAKPEFVCVVMGASWEHRRLTGQESPHPPPARAGPSAPWTLVRLPPSTMTLGSLLGRRRSRRGCVCRGQHQHPRQ